MNRYTTSLLLLLFVFSSSNFAAEKPNVLFIVADNLRNELGCYGSVAKTPNIDSLAQRGVRFTHAYCQQAVCNPSRSSFLTGLRPDSLHLWVNGTHFRDKNPDVITMPQWFKQNGYETRCTGKIFHNWHTEVKGDRRSWSADEFLHYANHGHDLPEGVKSLPANSALDIRMYGKVPLCECRDVPDEAYFDGRVAAEAVKTLGQIKDKPFFLAVGFWKPHAPFNAPKKYWDRYDKAQLPPFDPSRPSGAPEVAFHDSREVLGAPPNQVKPSAAQVTEMRHGYFANISFMDEQVGKVLKALDEHKLREKTIVVFISDHGYHIGEHGLWAKTSCFEFDARVPMILSVPGAKANGQTTESLAELLDLFPTLCAASGLKAPPGLDGASQLPVLADAKASVKAAAYSQHPRPAYADRTPKGVPDAMGYSVRTAAGRYTEWRDWETGKLVGAEFYEHPKDRLELTNQMRDGALSAAGQAARAALHKQFPPETPPAKR